jgi:hypothetical protein
MLGSNNHYLLRYAPQFCMVCVYGCRRLRSAVETRATVAALVPPLEQLMTRRELQPYREHGSGLVEIGGFRKHADWEETGHKEMHYAGTMRGGNWVEGLKDNVEWRINFGHLYPAEVDALLAALADWQRDQLTPFSIKLDGRPLDTLYLRGMLVDADDESPTGLVFSNHP